MQQGSESGRFAERVVLGVDEQGAQERIVVWIERRPGALWTVLRVVNPELRPSDAPRPEDVVFEGYEIDDALEAANAALSDDAAISEGDGLPAAIEPFTREELVERLERWFFGRE